MALIKKDRVEGMIEAGHIKPEKHLTGLVLPEEEAAKIGLEGDQAVILQPQRGRPDKRPNHQKNWYPEKKKYEVATLYAALGNIKKVADLAKVPKARVEEWVKEEWCLQVIARVKREENFHLDRKITSVIDKAVDKIVDRIENGDEIYDIKRGVAAKVAMSGRDLAIVSGTLFDKRQLIRGEATKITEAITSDEHLEQLALKFKEFVSKKRQQELPVMDMEETVEGTYESKEIK